MSNSGDEAWIDGAVSDLSDYYDRIHRRSGINLWQLAVVITVAALLFAFAIGWDKADSWLLEQLKTHRSQGFEWSIYITPRGWSWGIGFLFALPLAMAIGRWIEAFSRSYRADSTFKELYRADIEKGGGDAWADFRIELAEAIERGNLNTNTPFHVGFFIKITFKRHRSRAWPWLLPIIVLITALWLFERQEYIIATPDYIQSSEYRSVNKLRFDWTDVERAELSCRIVYDNYIPAYSRWGYDIYLPEDLKINLAKNLSSDLQALASADVLLKTLGTKIDIKYRRKNGHDVRFLGTKCLDYLPDSYSTSEISIIREIWQLDDLD